MIIFYHKYFKYLAWKMFGIKVEKVHFGVWLFIARWETWEYECHKTQQLSGCRVPLPLSWFTTTTWNYSTASYRDQQRTVGSYFCPCWMWLNSLIYMLTFGPTCSMLWVSLPLRRKCWCVLTFGNISSETEDFPLDCQGLIIFFFVALKQKN